MDWEAGIYSTRSGSPEFVFKTGRPLASARWNRTLGSKGSATHTILLRDAGIPKSMIREISRGNKYTLVQRWGDQVAYAGVIRNRRFVESGSMLILSSTELRAAILGTRYPFGVNEYNPAAGILTIVNRSHAATVRAVLLAATKSNTVSGWELPLDLPADGSGSFNAAWKHEEKLTTEDLLTQIEKDGSEIDFRPYLDANGYLRYAVVCQPVIASGVPFLLPVNAPRSIVLGLTVEEDFVGQRTGLLGFGKGFGQDTPNKFAPTSGDGIGDLPVMDSDEAFPDLEDATRLQNATNVAFARKNKSTEQWDYSLHIAEVGVDMAAPGAIHDLHVFGSDYIDDGSRPQRVITLSGDLSKVVKPGVQSYG